MNTNNLIDRVMQDPLEQIAWWKNIQEDAQLKIDEIAEKVSEDYRSDHDCEQEDCIVCATYAEIFGVPEPEVDDLGD